MSFDRRGRRHHRTHEMRAAATTLPPFEVSITRRRATLARLEYVGGDMFESVPPADVYIMKHIIHDWDDERCLRLLRNCHLSMEGGGPIICVDAVLPPMGDTGGTAGNTTVTDAINNNVLATSLQASGGTGLMITAGNTTSDKVTVTAQGNNFNSDQFGVHQRAQLCQREARGPPDLATD